MLPSLHFNLVALSPVAGDSGEDSFFDLSGGELINEMAPQPHPMVGEGTTALKASQCSSASSAEQNREIGNFPKLDSNLLQVHDTTA